MQGLNLHNTVADALAVINPWQELTFKKTATEWTPDARTPTVTETELTLKGKIQPADLQTVLSVFHGVYFRRRYADRPFASVGGGRFHDGKRRQVSACGKIRLDSKRLAAGIRLFDRSGSGGER